jgi:hypothetical protein
LWKVNADRVLAEGLRRKEKECERKQDEITAVAAGPRSGLERDTDVSVEGGPEIKSF